MRKAILCIALLCLATAVFAQQNDAKAKDQSAGDKLGSTNTVLNAKIPSGSRIYLAPIQNGFETYIAAGLQQKKVPVVVVADRSKADYELTGVSDTDKAGWAKMLFLGSQQTNEAASVKVVDLKTGDVVFAYSVNKTNSVRGKQSAGEAVAKHLKERIEGK